MEIYQLILRVLNDKPNHCVMKKLFTLILLCSAVSFSHGQLLLNEILYDPPGGIEGDANGDGTREAQEDEFLEIINTSGMMLDVSGYKIYDAEALENNEPRHLVPEGTMLLPGQAWVVFGGGVPTGSFGGAVVQTATGGTLNMNNSGDFVTITDAADNVLIEFDIEPLSNNPDESYTRNPDLTGDFEQHATNTELLYSPGTMIDGMPFATSILVESITVEGQDGATGIDVMDGTLQMIAFVLPEDATDGSVNWSLMPETGVASIDENGLLTAEDDGTVTVTATANDGSGVSGSVEIEISNQNIVMVESITVEGEGGATSIDVQGGTLQMMAMVMPENATDASVTWSLDPESGIASISDMGLLTAEEDGTVMVIATANDWLRSFWFGDDYDHQSVSGLERSRVHRI